MKFGRPLSMKVAATSIRSGLPGLNLCNFSLKSNVKCYGIGFRDRAVRRGEGEKVFEGSGQFIFRALFDPLAGEDEGGDGGGSVEKENRGWLDKK